MRTVSGLIGPLYYYYDLCTTTCALAVFKDQIKSLIKFSNKIILLVSIQVIFGVNKFLVSLPGINL